VDETFKEYLVELRTKMQQAGYQKEEEEERAPEYRLYIRRHEFETLEQLTRMAIELNNQKKTITLLILDEVIRLLGIDLLIHCKATIQGGGIITKIGGKRLRQQRERRTKRRSPYKPMRATAN